METFAIPAPFDAYAIRSVVVEQWPNRDRPDVCRHRIEIKDDDLHRGAPWARHLVPGTYDVFLVRYARKHTCDPSLLTARVETHLYDTFVDSAKPAALLADHCFDADEPAIYDHSEWRIEKSAMRPEPFARLLEDFVHRLAPDYTVTQLRLSYEPPEHE